MSGTGVEHLRTPPPEDGAESSAMLDRVLREEDYRVRLSADLCDLLRLGLLLRKGVGVDLSRRFSRRVGEEAERVEYGLIEVGARGNRTFAFLAEVVTAVRWMAKGLHAALHLRARIRRYLGDRTDLHSFRHDTEACIAWMGERLSALLDAASEEAAAVGLECPDGPFESESLRGENDTRWRLPQDVHGAAAVDERERIVEIATAFLSLADDVAKAGGTTDGSPEALAETLRSRFPLSAAQEARVRMHAIQSTYDTIVAATPLEGSDPHLKVFRGYVSILLHLLEVIAYLHQVLARVEDDARSADVRERASALLDPDEVRRHGVLFGVVNAIACFEEARRVAQSLVDEYTQTREVWLDLPPGRKLHLRPAGLIVRVVQHHGVPVRMRMGNDEVDARQLMDVILLAAGNSDATRVGFRGDERPLADLQTLFEARLGEEGFDRLPPSLAYLLPK